MNRLLYSTKLCCTLTSRVIDTLLSSITAVHNTEQNNSYIIRRWNILVIDKSWANIFVASNLSAFSFKVYTVHCTHTTPLNNIHTVYSQPSMHGAVRCRMQTVVFQIRYKCTNIKGTCFTIVNNKNFNRAVVTSIWAIILVQEGSLKILKLAII